MVDGGEEVLLGIEAEVFTHTVEDYDGVVDLVTDHGEDCGDEGLVYFHSEGEYAPEEGVEADDCEGCECYCCKCAE